MTRPDSEYIRRQAAVVLAGAGQTAILRTFVSAAGGSPQFGMNEAESFQQRIITGIFRAPSAIERSMPGGFSFGADRLISTDSALASRDEITWQGVRYTVAGSAQIAYLGGRVQYRSPLKLANG